MVGQQISYTVEEKDAMIPKNLDIEVKKATNSTNPLQTETKNNSTQVTR